jgi:hypothetical protein
MKKNIVLALLSVFVFGCKSNQATKLDMKSEVAIKGNWEIASVSFPGSEYIKVTSFDIADSKCFVGSTWKFVSNNNKGQMALTKPGCMAFDSDITWFINKEGNIVIKFLNGEKAKRVTGGYVLKVANQTGTSFQLIDRVNVGGNSTDLVYQFQRIN